MNPWIETAGVIALAAAAALVARRLSDMPRPYWTATYALSGAILIMMWLGRSYSALSLVPPVSWIAAGRTKFALVAVVPVIMLVPLFHSMRSRRVQFYGTIFLCLLVGLYAVWPFAACATNRGYLSSMPTRFDRYGVCLQSTDYTCGPAAAVTALRLLGIRGEEGKIAIASHTSSAIGTPPDMLCEGLRSLYFTNALKCELRYFERLSDLPKGAPILAVIQYTIVEDHYVVILDITPRHVIVADSNRGKVAYSHELFLKRWRKLGIVMTRVSTGRFALNQDVAANRRAPSCSGIECESTGCPDRLPACIDWSGRGATFCWRFRCGPRPTSRVPRKSRQEIESKLNRAKGSLLFVQGFQETLTGLSLPCLPWEQTRVRIFIPCATHRAG